MVANELAKMSTSSRIAVRVRSSPSGAGGGGAFFCAMSSDAEEVAGLGTKGASEASEASEAVALLVFTMNARSRYLSTCAA